MEDTGMELFITLCLPREIRIGSISIAIGIPWIRQAGYDTYLRGIKSRSGAEGQ